MDSRFTRRTAIGLIGAAVVPVSVVSAAEQQRERPPAIDGETVRAFVGAAHGNFDKTREMLEANPGLLNATWDWGGGDFEAAIGGAGHMGRRDIAEYLISKGAKTTIFVHAMLGDLEVVKAMIARYPGLKDSKGPHGIPLKRHAEMGGKGAKNVLAYLETLD